MRPGVRFPVQYRARWASRRRYPRPGIRSTDRINHEFCSMPCTPRCDIETSIFHSLPPNISLFSIPQASTIRSRQIADHILASICVFTSRDKFGACDEGCQRKKSPKTGSCMSVCTIYRKVRIHKFVYERVHSTFILFETRNNRHFFLIPSSSSATS